MTAPPVQTPANPGPVPTGGGGTDWGKFLGPIAGVAGSLIDFISNRNTNKANAAQAQKQMDFQAEQSATQHQREVADLRAAGLNPAIGYTAGGNTAATGSAATMQPYKGGGAAALNAIAAYNDVANGVAQRQLLREQTDATSASRAYTQAQTSALLPMAILGQSGAYQSDYARSETAKRRGETFDAQNAAERWNLMLRQGNAGINSAEAAAELQRKQATLTEQQFTNEWFRKNISPYVNSTAQMFKPILSITGAIRP